MPETDLHIVDRLKKLLPPLTADERKQLKENIEADGEVQDKILWWNDGTKNVVCDGMHRWEIVRGTDIPYDTQEMHFADYEEAEMWVLNHQLGRRNLTPIAMKRIVGEMYNRLKAKRGGDHKSQESKCQNDTLIGDISQKLAETAGISPSTVKRAGARVEAIAKLTKPAQLIADRATDAEIKTLSTFSPGDQTQVANNLRMGRAQTVKEAMKGFKAPQAEKPKKPDKPPKKYDRPFWYKQWQQSIGPLCRLVDKIANDLGESKCQSQAVVQDHLNVATEEICEWLGVKR